jgi:hypothetical protein
MRAVATVLLALSLGFVGDARATAGREVDAPFVTITLSGSKVVPVRQPVGFDVRISGVSSTEPRFVWVFVQGGTQSRSQGDCADTPDQERILNFPFATLAESRPLQPGTSTLAFTYTPTRSDYGYVICVFVGADSKSGPLGVGRGAFATTGPSGTPGTPLALSLGDARSFTAIALKRRLAKEVNRTGISRAVRSCQRVNAGAAKCAVAFTSERFKYAGSVRIWVTQRSGSLYWNYAYRIIRQRISCLSSGKPSAACTDVLVVT